LARDLSSGVGPIRRCWMLRNLNILLHGDGIRGFLERLGFGEEVENRGREAFLSSEDDLVMGLGEAEEERPERQRVVAQVVGQGRGL